MVDFSLSEPEALYRKTARDFATAELAPLGRAVRERDEGKSPWDIVRPVYKTAASLGFTRLLIPENYGGLGGSCFENVLIMEEFGAADLGIAASYFNVSITAPVIIARAGTEEQKQRFLMEIAESTEYVLSSASSEPDVAGADSFYMGPDKTIGLKTKAVEQEDGFVLTGTKSAFSTNAGAAKAFFVMARTDPDAPAFAATSMFFVPATSDGLTVGKKTELAGWKTAMHAEVTLDDVRVPKENLIGERGANLGMFFTQIIPFLASGLAAAYVGLARAAFECAWAYAHERRSWGKPIIDHQPVALKLADMKADLEAARLMVWKLAWAADKGDPEAAGVLSPAAKTMAVDAAIANAERALKIMGGYGVAEEYPAARFLLDAWVGDSCDGTRDLLRLGITNYMRMAAGGPPPSAH